MDVRHFSWFLSLMVRVSGCYLVGEKIDFPRMLQTRTWSTDHVFSEKTIISEATTFCSLVCGCLLPAFIGRVFPRQSTYRAWSELTHCLCIGSTRPWSASGRESSCLSPQGSMGYMGSEKKKRQDLPTKSTAYGGAHQTL